MKFLLRATYTLEGVKALNRTGATKRAAAVQELFQAAGGRLESIYFASRSLGLEGPVAYAIAEFPDGEGPRALALASNAVGHAIVNFTRLLSPQEMDETIEKSKNLPVPGK